MMGKVPSMLCGWNRFQIRCGNCAAGMSRRRGIIMADCFLKTGMRDIMTDCAFVHEVTVRKQGERNFQYIGNKIIWSEEHMLPTYMEEAKLK